MKHGSYREIDGLRIIEFPAVCPVIPESKLLARHASGERKSAVLDMGTGTGYIALSLAKLGFSVTAVDIDPEAVENSRKNAQLNALKIDLFRSDLFSEVKDTYDIIIFSTPTFNGDRRVYKLSLSLAKAFPAYIRNYLALLHELPLIRQAIFKKRKVLISSFLSGCRKHLNPGGRIFMIATQEDMDHILLPYCQEYPVKIRHAPVPDVVAKRYLVSIYS